MNKPQINARNHSRGELILRSGVRPLVWICAAALLICVQGTGRCAIATNGIIGWEELKEKSLRGVSSSSFSDSALVIRYQRTVIVNCTDNGDALKNTRDEWSGELRIASKCLYLMEYLKSATPAVQVESPRIPIRQGFSCFDGQYRSIVVFEEVKSFKQQPKVFTLAEIHRGREPDIGLPVVLTERDYRTFLEKVTNVTVSAQSESGGGWMVNGIFVNRPPDRNASLVFSNRDSQAYLIRAIVSLGKSGADMKFENWRTFENYCLPETIVIERKNGNGDVSSREELRVTFPPQFVKLDVSLFNLKIPTFSQVSDYREGEDGPVTYQAGKRLPTVAELKAMRLNGARAKAEYYLNAMTTTRPRTAYLVTITLLILALIPLYSVFRRRYK